jgi:tRNA U34 5-carboxymethylaminomethyl modifying GTPase MnmE/TrmE
MLGNEVDREAQQRIERARREGARILDLRGLKLRELPEAIASLTQLQQLFLSHNKLRSLPEAIASLTQLHLLYLSTNQLTKLPESIAFLTRLQQLDLSHNKLRELPEAIASLTRLQQLDLSNNQLRELPEAIASLTLLRELDLSNNQLRELPESLASLTQLRQLYLYNNPLNPDLAAAYEQGTKAVLQYLQAKAEAKITLNEAKLILIGEGEVGKSCLLGALREDEWLESRPIPTLAQRYHSMVGILAVNRFIDRRTSCFSVHQPCIWSCGSHGKAPCRALSKSGLP